MKKHSNHRPRPVTASAVVIMLVVRFALGAPGVSSSSTGATSSTPARSQGSVTWEWRLERIIRP